MKMIFSKKILKVLFFQNNLFGTCEATYTTSPTNNNEIHIRKFVDHSTCLNQPTKSFTFDRVFPCASKKVLSIYIYIYIDISLNLLYLLNLNN